MRQQPIQEASKMSSNGNSAILVKASRGEEKRRFQLVKENGSATFSFESLMDKLRTVFSFSSTCKVSISYLDDENDVITINTDIELDAAVAQMKHADTLKIHLSADEEPTAPTPVVEEVMPMVEPVTPQVSIAESSEKGDKKCKKHRGKRAELSNEEKVKRKEEKQLKAEEKAKQKAEAIEAKRKLKEETKEQKKQEKRLGAAEKMVKQQAQEAVKANPELAEASTPEAIAEKEFKKAAKGAHKQSKKAEIPAGATNEEVKQSSGSSSSSSGEEDAARNKKRAERQAEKEQRRKEKEAARELKKQQKQAAKEAKARKESPVVAH